MEFLQKLKFLFFLTVLLSVGLNTNAVAVDFEMELVATIQNPVVPGETLSTRILVGANDRATDRFDTAWDVVAIPGGVIQAYIDHPEYDQATHILWRDTRSSMGFPKEWDLLIQPSQTGTFVTLKWSVEAFANIPSSIRLRLVDLDQGNQEVDLRSVANYTYVHTDPAIPHHFRLVADEPVVSTPPATTPPPGSTPPVEIPPQEQPPPLTILTELLPPGALHRAYKADLEAKGGTTPYRWDIVSGGLPKGLKLDATTGAISGKPKRLGRYTATVRLVDANGQTDQKSFTLSVVRRVRPSHEK